MELLTIDIMKPPGQGIDFIGYLAAWFGIVLTVLTIIEKVFKSKGPGHLVVNFLWSWFVAPFRIQKRQSGIEQSIAVILVKIESIEKEVKPNGGSSLRDSVNRQERITAEILHNQKVSSEKRKADYDLNPSPIFITDENNYLTYVNPAWLKMVGCDNEKEMLGRGWLRVIPDDIRDKVEHEADRLALQPAPFSGDVRFKHLKTGAEIKAYCVTRLINPNGEMIETIGTLKL